MVHALANLCMPKMAKNTSRQIKKSGSQWGEWACTHGPHIFLLLEKGGVLDFCLFPMCSHDIPTLFPPSSQWVPNMFTIACLSSTVDTYVSNSPNEEITYTISWGVWRWGWCLRFFLVFDVVTMFTMMIPMCSSSSHLFINMFPIVLHFIPFLLAKVLPL
jgi:hypothetical protein